MKSTHKQEFGSKLRSIHDDYLNVKAAMLDMTYEEFTACISMLMEEYCIINDEDITEMMGFMAVLNAVKKAGLEDIVTKLGEEAYGKKND